jgi:hypothetical protein
MERNISKFSQKKGAVDTHWLGANSSSSKAWHGRERQLRKYLIAKLHRSLSVDRSILIANFLELYAFINHLVLS